MVLIGGVMKKLITFICSVIAFACIVLLCVSFSIQEITSKVVTNVVLSEINVQEVTNVVRDIIPEVDDERLSTIEDQIIQSEALNELSTTYLNEFATHLQDQSQMDHEKLKEELGSFFDANIDLVAQELGQTLKPEQEQTLRDKVTSHSEEITQKIEQVITNKTVTLPKEQQTMLNLYANMNTNTLKIVVSIIILVCAMTIGIVYKSAYHPLRPIGIASTLAGLIVLFVFPLFIQMIEEILSTDLLGKAVAIPVHTLQWGGGIALGIGILLILLYYLIHMILQCKKKIKL